MCVSLKIHRKIIIINLKSEKFASAINKSSTLITCGAVNATLYQK